ncbi:hypothetical protein [Vibrio scophthalmi]|uniref:BRCT domain-containing protein n=1 Tax=Vibrio scophthalmi LMG 19158 TaxID=870967 RepID=F9RKW2_9VIBR|nr:hypothetical protein [Vibrio scophthalmi]EGU39436.1 hypothetical protein VIS19158_04061 [Vibrio scophthalmi LMG 19158]
MNQAIKDKLPQAQEVFTCLYRNSKGQVSVQELANASLNESNTKSYIQGWSIKHSRPITLLTDQVIQTFSHGEEAIEAFESGNYSENNQIELPNSNRLSSQETMDICFTGFEKKEKEELVKLAETHNMVVKKSVTKYLNILCFGRTAGPSKLAQANSQGVIVLTRIQLENLLITGELPDSLAEDINLKDSSARKKVLSQEELVADINTSLAGLRELGRRENLIALFHEGSALGWKFHVPDVFREALDIKLTPISIQNNTISTWTQGHAYSFQRGDSIGSVSTKDWNNFLQQDGILLQIAYSNPAGFEENKRIEGKFTGSFYQSKTHKSSRQLNDSQIEVSSYVYDSGSLTIDIFKVNEAKTRVEKFDSIALSQVDFVTLLQQGYYWKKPLDKDDDTPIEKITLIP